MHNLEPKSKVLDPVQVYYCTKCRKQGDLDYMEQIACPKEEDYTKPKPPFK